MWGVVRPRDFCAARHSQHLRRMVSVCRGPPPPSLLPRNLPGRRLGRPAVVPSKSWGTGDGGWRNDAQRRRAGVDLRAIVGDRSPRALVMACGLLVLAAVRMSGRAIRERCTGPFIAGWALGIVGVCAARIGFASLGFLWQPGDVAGPAGPAERSGDLALPASVRSADRARGRLGPPDRTVAAPWPRSRCGRGGEPRSTLAADRRGGRGAGGRRVKEDRASRASQCHSLGGGVVGRARSRRSCTLGDRGAGNQDPRRNDRRRTRFARLDTAHRRRCRGRQVGQSSAAEPGACAGG